MPSENQRKSKQASRSVAKLKPCDEPLAKLIKLLRKLPLDTSLVDLDQDETLRKLRSERLSASASNVFKRKPRPYPSDISRSAWRQRNCAEFPITREEWPTAERERIERAKRTQDEEEAKYQLAYKQTQIEVLSRYASSLSQEFADYLLSGSQYEVMNLQEIEHAVSLYNWYRFHHDFMRALVDAAHRRIKGHTYPLGSALPSWAYIGPHGRFRSKQAPIVEALTGVEVDRIRMCANKNCRRIFWAGRIARPGSAKNDQICCLPECSHAARNQRLRARYVDPNDDFAARKLTANEEWFKKKTREKGKGKNGAL